MMHSPTPPFAPPVMPLVTDGKLLWSSDDLKKLGFFCHMNKYMVVKTRRGEQTYSI